MSRGHTGRYSSSCNPCILDTESEGEGGGGERERERGRKREREREKERGRERREERGRERERQREKNGGRDGEERSKTEHYRFSMPEREKQWFTSFQLISIFTGQVYIDLSCVYYLNAHVQLNSPFHRSLVSTIQ